MPARARLSRPKRHLALLPVLLLVLAQVALVGPAGRVQAQNDETGVTTLTGSLVVTNPFVLDIVTEPYVLLNDLSNFVERDYDGDLPEFVQEAAQLEGELVGASYTLTLPIAPQATLNDVDAGEEGGGVHVYAVDLWANIVGDPFVQPIEGGGWSTSFTSVVAAPGTNEITGGKLVVWAPDDEQSFPAGFGDDGLLFTEDDPVEPIAAGWTVVDLDAAPFAQIREPIAEVDILEGDGGLKDLSDLGFTEAFDALVADLRLRYPFTDFKGIDWDALIEEFRPRIEAAEQDGDFNAYQIALMRFTVAIGDGHVAVDPNIEYLIDQYGGGLGLTLGETDDGQVIVTSVAPDSPAEGAGLAPGVEIVSWNGVSIDDALDQTDLLFASSSPHTTRLQQLILITRGESGEDVSFAYLDANGAEQAIDLEVVDDLEGLIEALGGTGFEAEMPVTVEILPSGIGYIRVNTFYDDLILMTHAWEWAIQRLNDLEVEALIVDVRGNSGGNGGVALYFAGSFVEEEVELAEALFATEDGEFVPNGTYTVLPTEARWGGEVAVLIDENCASACEIFTGAMALNDDHLIVGQYATAGVEAGVYPWLLPGDLFFQAPLEYFEADGQVWIEGVGVPPTIDVPVTVESLLSEEDVVLQAAEAALS
jgi:C-terminal processing protease CtpA/Prc